MFAVVGASGRTGSKVTRRLLAAAQSVRGIVRGEAAAQALEASGAMAARLSLADSTALTQALRGAQAVYALLPEDLRTADFHAQRRRMTDALAQAVRAAGVPHVVLLSAAVAGATETVSSLAAELRYAEAALAAAGCELTLLRASYFQENVLSALPAARSAGVFPSFFASAAYAFPTVATGDIAELATRCLLEPQPGIIDVQGPSYSARELAAQLGAALGRELRVVDVPGQAQGELLVQAGLPRDYAQALVDLFACYRPDRLPAPSDRVFRGSTRLEDILPELVTQEAER